MIGILGGTFDPVHFGHLRPALEVRQALALDHVRFIPNRVPPHRETPWLDVEQRLALLQTAIEGESGFQLDQRELLREGNSYMVDTLDSLRADFPDQSLCLILGMDAFLGLENWRQWRRLPELCNLVVLCRPGSAWPDAHSQLLHDLPATITRSAGELATQASGRILIQSVTQLDVSSSYIRAEMAQGRSVRYLMPDAVWKQLTKMVKN
jgi:nicotinate-nucleotide adenylyltransferase